MFIIIAAIGLNRELGKDNALLWDLPDDMKFFRDTTRGKPVLMGRKTFESIGRLLPGRKNIVISRNPDYKPHGVMVCQSLESAAQMARNFGEDVFIIGGGTVYQKALLFTSRMYLTYVDGVFPEADTFFPQFDFDAWQEVSRIHHPVDERHQFAFDIIQYQRRIEPERFDDYDSK